MLIKKQPKQHCEVDWETSMILKKPFVFAGLLNSVYLVFPRMLHRHDKVTVSRLGRGYRGEASCCQKPYSNNNSLRLETAEVTSLHY